MIHDVENRNNMVDNKSLGAGEQFIEDGQHGMGEGQQIIKEGSKNNHSELNSSTDKCQTLKVCPMCKGKGYYEEIADTDQLCNVEKSGQHKTCELPAISQNPYKLEQLFRTNPKGKLQLSRFSDSAVPKLQLMPKQNTRLPPVHIPHIESRRTPGSASQIISSPNNTALDNFPQIVNVLPLPTKLERLPEDVARLAAIKLNRNDWEMKKAGLEDCLRLCHFHPEELEPHMNLVYRTLSWLLVNYRPQVTLFACQAARDFFTLMRSVCRPDFDELVCSLLQRTADSNKYVRLHSNNALDKMVTYIPTIHAVRPLVDKGPSHNNPLVRTSAARLLTCIVALRTPNTILTLPSLRDACKKILETATLLMDDNNLDTRETAKKLIQRFLNEEEFEAIYYAEVDENLRKRVDRSFVQLKYKKLMAQD